jgi:hypothetical protein
MEQKHYETITKRLEEITPALVEEIQQVFEQDPDLVVRYGSGLKRLAEQEVIRLRDYLLGALLLEQPNVLRHQIEWLVQVGTIRNYNMETVQQHLDRFRAHLQQDLSPADRVEILKIFDKAVERIKGL